MPRALARHSYWFLSEDISSEDEVRGKDLLWMWVAQNRTMKARNMSGISWVASLSRGESWAMQNQQVAASTRHVEWEVQVQGTNGTPSADSQIAWSQYREKEQR